MTIQEMQQALTSLRTRLTTYRSDSLSSTDDTPRVIDETEQRRINQYDAEINTMQEQLNRLLANQQQGNQTNRGASPVNISHSVQLVPQPTNMSCWAAGIAMMVSWKNNISISPENIAESLGYEGEMKTGLNPEDTAAFTRWGMSWEPPVNYTIEAFAGILRRGPVWIAAKVGGPHVRVIYAMSGDGTPDGTRVSIHDPSPVNSGSSYTKTMRELASEMNTLVSEELSFDKPIYLATI